MIRLPPSFRERVWGSANLEPWFPGVAGRIGEVWFTADPPHPILVKFLFTTGNLSVQVHPAGDAGVGKTEMWHILRAEPGARIALGFREPVTRERLRESALSGRIEQLLQWFPVQAGQTYFTPAGTVHAIGAGITLCEIQQNSDITYRLYDYGRPRDLHLEEGVAAADLGPHPGPSAGAPLEDGWTRLVHCPYFVTDLIETAAETTCPPGCLLVVLDGHGKVDGEAVRAGQVCLDAIRIRPESPMRLLRTYAPVSALSR